MGLEVEGSSVALTGPKLPGAPPKVVMVVDSELAAKSFEFAKVAVLFSHAM